jgi:hypothetical protein
MMTLDFGMIVPMRPRSVVWQFFVVELIAVDAVFAVSGKTRTKDDRSCRSQILDDVKIQNLPQQILALYTVPNG